MFLIDDIALALAAKKLVPMIAGAGIAAAIGFGSAEIYEHKVPWALGPQLARLKASVPGQVAKAANDGRTTGIKAQADADAPAFHQWSAQLSICNNALLTQRDTAARAITKAEANQSTSTSAAYRLGRATCGALDANSPPPAGSGNSVVLRPSGADLADFVNAGATPAPHP